MRRDMRLHDNAALYRALKQYDEVIPLFILDRNILDHLEDKKDARVEFILRTLELLSKDLKSLSSGMIVRFGKPEEVWKDIIKEFNFQAVFYARDYEKYAKKRDEKVGKLLHESKINFKGYKDHVIFDLDEVLKDDGDPYVVFTPYKRKWLEKLKERGETLTSNFYFKSYPNEKYFNHLRKWSGEEVPALSEIGFEKTEIPLPIKEVKRKVIKNYDQTRNYPAIPGTSKLGIHFRFGTIAIREKAQTAASLNDTFLSELIWRDFYANILNHFPHVEERSFREKYEEIEWENNEDHFDKWKKGITGYPIVDAGMRELLQTGYMHNRVRMITASFLTKHLLIDWRWGEAWFAQKLLDYDLASNNGGWQWAAGCGTDAAPYFRIFNPTSQMEKFDKEKKYIKKWVPEYGTNKYPAPIIDHKEARERCLSRYKTALDRR